MIRTWIAAVIALVLVSSLSAALLQTTPQLPARSANEETAFLCPMHPDYTLDVAGKCPRCGMDLSRLQVTNSLVTLACEFHVTNRILQNSSPTFVRDDAIKHCLQLLQISVNGLLGNVVSCDSFLTILIHQLRSNRHKLRGCEKLLYTPT